MGHPAIVASGAMPIEHSLLAEPAAMAAVAVPWLMSPSCSTFEPTHEPSSLKRGATSSNSWRTTALSVM